MRKLTFILISILVFSLNLVAQNMSGQWTGAFVSGGDIWGGRTEYVLELEVRNDAVEGHSYTYFSINGKRCYVICKLKGSYDKGSKSISVTEVSKVKSNTPPDFRDCLQTHMLTFFKQGEREVLKGKWKSATIKDNCGTGDTELERKALVKVTPVIPPSKESGDVKITPKKEEAKPKITSPQTANKPKSTTPKKTVAPPVAKKVTGKNPPASSTKSPPKTTASNNPKKDTVKKVEKPVTVENTREKEGQPETAKKISSFGGGNKLQARNKNVIKTFEVDEPEFTVHLYDNGQVDGDTVTLFFNGKLIVSKQRLSTTPISIKIRIDSNINDNDLVMIAENLGSIPPNTALMVVTVGDKRYEVNITSTEQVNGTVRFKLKE